MKDINNLLLDTIKKDRTTRRVSPAIMSADANGGYVVVSSPSPISLSIVLGISGGSVNSVQHLNCDSYGFSPKLDEDVFNTECERLMEINRCGSPLLVGRRSMFGGAS